MARTRDEALEPELIEPDDVSDVAEDEDASDDADGGSPETIDVSAPILPAGSDGSEVIPRDPVDRYFWEISKYPLLTREQELELALRVHEDGDAEAAQQLVLSNLRLVVKIAMEYRRVWTNLLDLIQEGNVGLLQAVKRFDPHRGVKLSSYAAYWIRAYLLKYLIDNIRLVRVGSSRAERKLFFQLNRVRRELESEGEEPTPRLIAERIGVKEPEVVDMQRRLAQGDLSMDAPVRRDDPEAASFGDLVAAEARDVDDVVSEKTMNETFREHIDAFRPQLDEREAVILDERILAEDPRTLQEVGDRFGLTRERVRQIEKRLVGRLRDFLEERLVDFEYWAPED